MIAPQVTAVHLRPGYAHLLPGAAAAGSWVGVVSLRQVEPAPRPAPRHVAKGLAALLFDGADGGARRLSSGEAARGFAEGSGYLTGQMVDRIA